MTNIIIITCALVASHIALTLYLYRRDGTILTYIHHNKPRRWRGYYKVHPDLYNAIVADKRTQAEIAKDYGVSRSLIGRIKQDHGKTNTMRHV
jgi:hypothetical protein